MKKSIIILLSGLVTSTLAYAQVNEDAAVRVAPPSNGSGALTLADEDAPEDQGPSGSVEPTDAAVLVVANPNIQAMAKPVPGAPADGAIDGAAVDGQPIEDDGN